MYTGSEDGTIKLWDLKAPSFQRNYEVGSGVTTVALHPNQAELITGDMDGKIKVRLRFREFLRHVSWVLQRYVWFRVEAMWDCYLVTGVLLCWYVRF